MIREFIGSQSFIDRPLGLSQRERDLTGSVKRHAVRFEVLRGFRITMLRVRIFDFLGVSG